MPTNRLTTLLAYGSLGAVLLLGTACGGSGDEPAEPSGDDGNSWLDGLGGDETEDDPADSAENESSGGDDSVTGATLHTSVGDIELVLFTDRAPETVDNFVGLAEGDRATNPETGDDAFYDGTIFHRVIPDFMIQGGDPTGTGTGGPGYAFADEIDPELAFDEPGILAMANSGPDTNGSQFFVTTAPTPHLQGLHTIFGEVADEDSLAVAEEISTVDTNTTDRPETDIVVEEVVIHRE